ENRRYYLRREDINRFASDISESYLKQSVEIWFLCPEAMQKPGWSQSSQNQRRVFVHNVTGQGVIAIMSLTYQRH
ncbi:hypothetical protein KL930_000001, partial [Ogataea haglerorum]